MPCHSVHSGYFLRLKKNLMVAKLHSDLLIPMEAKTFEKSIFSSREKRERNDKKLIPDLIFRYTRSLLHPCLWAESVSILVGKNFESDIVKFKNDIECKR